MDKENDVSYTISISKEDYNDDVGFNAKLPKIMAFLNDSAVLDAACAPGTIPRICSVCYEVQIDDTDYINHVKECTIINSPKNGNMRIQCSICGKSLLNSYFGEHIKLHQNFGAFQCSLCCLGFNTSRRYREHHQKYHTNEKKYRCDCGETFAVYHDLKRHRMKIHTTPGKVFDCKICKKIFSTAQNLQIHNRKHTGEKPYSCHFCKKSYQQSHSLKEHLSAFHSSVRV